jgi:hypothetical protein
MGVYIFWYSDILFIIHDTSSDNMNVVKSLLGEVFIVGETWGAESLTPMLFLTVLLFVALCLIIWGRVSDSSNLGPLILKVSPSLLVDD